jgi:hypothetical protein
MKPNRDDELKRAQDEVLAPRQQQVEQPAKTANPIDENEALRAKKAEEIKAKLEADRIDQREAVRQERAYDNKLLVDENARQQAELKAREHAQSQSQADQTPKDGRQQEETGSDWRRRVNEQTKQAGQPADETEKKKVEEQEVDWRRLRTDPEYRREIQNRREAAQERTGEQENEHARSQSLEQ